MPYFCRPSGTTKRSYLSGALMPMLANHGCSALQGYMRVGSAALTDQELISVVSSEIDNYPALALLLILLLNRKQILGSVSGAH